MGTTDDMTLSTAVAEYVKHLICSAPVTPSYRAALEAALALPGNILSDAPNTRWARPVWMCCTVAGGHLAQAVPVGAVLEIFMVALDVLDDVEDDEETPLRADLGSARALNASTGLLFLAQQGLLNTSVGLEAGTILLHAALQSCSGQHADLDSQPPQLRTLETALAVAAGKSASLVAVACRLGALAAAADSTTQQLYAQLGWYIGMMAQLINDIKAVHPNATAKTDIVLSRPTLPLAYADVHVLPKIHTDDATTRMRLWTGGAAYLTWAVADVYRRHALGLISGLTVDSGSRKRLATLLPILS
ncbi:MAG: polyprenyl synthetase family protein [Herpetosiphonaceae bacterium]|nr:polyprenyl synthetase family protein [Herpetosiphonaceae bacterium]